MGKQLPAFYIYTGEKHHEGWHCDDDIDTDTAFMCTDNGWTKDWVGIRWLKDHFDRHASSSRLVATRLVICDNHSSPDTEEFQAYCLKHKIALFWFSAHATYFLQSLSVGVFSSLDHCCNQECEDWLASVPLYSSLSKANFIPMCERARKKAVTAENIKAAWAACGIHPFNCQRVLTHANLSLLFRKHTESPPPREGLRPCHIARLRPRFKSLFPRN